MKRVLVLFFVLLASCASAALQDPDWPLPSRSPAGGAVFASPSPAPGASSTPPPYDVPLRHERWEQLPSQQISRAGQIALAIRPQRWRHGETENFIFHCRGLSDAVQIAREIEFYLWYGANSLGANQGDYTSKSRVYVFADEKEWQEFIVESRAAPWTNSLAIGDELFLSVRAPEGGFDSQTLAHETTSAVVARLYRRHWPVWSSEGFAEYIGAASIAARHSRSPQSTQRKLTYAKMTAAGLLATQRTPVELDAVWRNELEIRPLPFQQVSVGALPESCRSPAHGRTGRAGARGVYGDELRNMDEFEKRFSRFTR